MVYIDARWQRCRVVRNSAIITFSWKTKWMHARSHIEIKKMVGRHLDRSSSVHASIVAVLIMALAIELYVFARVQDIWLDESTQLSGITLDFWEMLRWLAGADPDRLGVPGDRMPPVSYLLDWLWLHFCGPAEMGFRLFHSAFVIAGVSGLAIVTLRELGPLATIVSLGFLVLSPKLIQTGVEIRAYPIFFAITCAQAAVFIQLMACRPKLEPKLLTIFTAICLASIYTHFYGVVSSCAFFLALGISFLGRTVALAEIIGAFLIMAVGSLALIPIVSAAGRVLPFVPVTATIPTAVEKEAAVRYLTYLLQLIGDPANMISISASILFFVGSIAVLAVNIFAAVMNVRNRNVKPFDLLIAVVLSGVFVTITASFFVRTFDAMNASYSGWLLVPLSLLVGAGANTVTGLRSWDAAGKKVAVGAMLAGAGISTYMFLVHAPMFVHGPHRFIGALYDKAATPKAIVYEAGAAWGWVYIPLVYSRNSEVVQYRASDDRSGLVRAGPTGTETVIQKIEAAVAPYQVLLLADIRLRTYQDLRQCQNRSSACPDFHSGAIKGALIGTGKWRETGKERSFGHYDAQVTILERVSGHALPHFIRNQ